MNQLQYSVRLFILLLTIASVCGEDEIDTVVAYRNGDIGYPQEGFIIKYECTDSKCQNCQFAYERSVHFNVCFPNVFQDFGGRGQIYQCHQGHFDGSVRIRSWNDINCNGPLVQEITSNMYIRADCDRFFKYTCMLSGRGELRMSTEEENDSRNVNIIIVMVSVSIVCMIGIIVGYLMHRKRKKAAEQMLLSA